MAQWCSELCVCFLWKQQQMPMPNANATKALPKQLTQSCCNELLLLKRKACRRAWETVNKDINLWQLWIKLAVSHYTCCCQGQPIVKASPLPRPAHCCIAAAQRQCHGQHGKTVQPCFCPSCHSPSNVALHCVLCSFINRVLPMRDSARVFGQGWCLTLRFLAELGFQVQH